MAVHRQPVPISKSGPPLGCFCSTIDPRHGACLTCTCPDCGATGRYGVGLVHRPGCA